MVPMLDDDVALFGRDPSKACRAYSDPLFLSDAFLTAGHNAAIPNGTTTFVRRRGQVYVCTCGHVAEILNEPGEAVGPNPVAMLQYGPAFQKLAFWSAEGLQSVLWSPDGKMTGHHADVALANLGHTWQHLARYKQKVAIDLDTWEPPPWDRVRMCCAAGYPESMKSDDGKLVNFPMPLVYAELQTLVTSSSREFTLHSKFDEPQNLFMSGMSGGPVLATWDDRFTPVGLVVEGEPSRPGAPTAWTEPNEIMIRAVMLTPEIFDGWLASANRK